MDFVIGIKFEKVDDGYILHQRGYLKELLRKYNLTRCNPTRNTKSVENTNLRSKNFSETTYRSEIGNLLYLALSTRSDIMFSVSRGVRKEQ